MRERREELNAVMARVREVLTAKDDEIKMSAAPVISYITAEFKKLQIEGLSFLKRAETDPRVDSAVILAYQNAAEELIIEINKIVL